MALAILKELQQALLNQMLKEGLVNDQFEQLMTSKRTESSHSVVQAIEEYCADMEATVSKLKIDCNNPEVDFSHLVALCHLIREKSARIGAVHVNSACLLLIHASEQKNKKRFSQTLNWLKNDFAPTQNQLETYARMERRIIIVKEMDMDSSSSSS